MKKSMKMLPLVFAVLVLLTACGPKPEEKDINSPVADDSVQVKTETGTSASDEDVNEETTEDETTNDEAEDTTEPNEDGTLPDFDIKAPDLKVTLPDDDSDNDLVIPNVELNKDLKVTLPVVNDIKPPVPDPAPQL